MDNVIELTVLGLSLPTFSGLTSILTAVCGLGLVIFLHELGHFAVAKWCNVYVERFSIGFGPVLLGWKWGETEYALSAIPFGGYVKMLGQDDADPSQMTSEEIASDPRSYVAKNVFQRMAIISAGVTMNVITAVIFYAFAFTIGIESTPAIIGQVRPGLPAWEAGIQRGDLITHLDGREISSFEDLALHVALSGNTITLEGKHADGTAFKTEVTPDATGTRPQIGIGPSQSLVVSAKPKEKPDAKPVAPGTAASAAEPAIEFEDVVTSINGTEVQSFAEFQNLLAARRGAPAQVGVRRAGSSEPVMITIGSNAFRTLGLRMDTGLIDSIQQGSPAAEAGLRVNDKIARVNGRNVGTDIDPIHLPDEFAALAGESVEVVVSRQNKEGQSDTVTVKLVPLARPAWLEPPDIEGEPVAIASIGVAFHIVPFVLHVDPEGPAAKAGLTANAAIQKVELITPEGATPDGDKVITFELDDGKPVASKKSGFGIGRWFWSLFGYSPDQVATTKNAVNWSCAFWTLQRSPNRHVKLTYKLKDETEPKTVTIIPEADPTWTLPTIGVIMQRERQMEKAENIAAAFPMAWHRSTNTVLNIYLTLNNLLTGRLSYKELHGPLGIAQAAYQTAQAGNSYFLVFLGFLSLNLAVLNFLPIPVLDGGHMVFLLWEAVTRRRPSDKILHGSIYVGVAFLLGLMALVIILDVSRLFGGMGGP